MLSRRALIGKAAVGAAAALAAGAAGTAVASVRRSHGANGDAADERDAKDAPETFEAAASPPPWALVKPLAAGSVIAHGWRLTELGPVEHGASVATLANERGRSQRVHLCRNDGAPQGIVYTRRVDLVVMNEGYGDLPTDEGLAQAVAELAHVIAANEAAADGCLTELVPHAERVRRFASVDGPSMDGKLR